jgi:hypothetical protein
MTYAILRLLMFVVRTANICLPAFKVNCSVGYSTPLCGGRGARNVEPESSHGGAASGGLIECVTVGVYTPTLEVATLGDLRQLGETRARPTD